jgi:protein-ribulosamine 3-kinase
LATPTDEGIYSIGKTAIITMKQIWETVSRHISSVTGTPFVIRSSHAVGGGCINTAYVIQDLDREYFVKLNDVDRLDMFSAECAGLDEIVKSHAIRVPHPVCCGTTDATSYIVMEHIASGNANRDTYLALGQRLADMHRVTHQYFGWNINNTIGSTPQINTRTDDWIHFWREHRLGYQLGLASRNGYGRELQARGDQLLQQLPAFFTDYRPLPSLLHGDLWSGNFAIDADGNPYIFDPAVYYGDRETDIAMTELFGGFPVQFYQAYSEVYPLDNGYVIRKKLYNLYHIINHLNLFGGGYLAQARQMIDSLLSETG